MKILKACMYVAVIAALLLAVGCEKEKKDDMQISSVMGKIKTKANFADPKEEDLKNVGVAERYGINPNDVEEGTVYYSGAEKNPDKVILVKAKDEDALSRVEEAMSAEVVGMTDTWGDDATMRKKVDAHIIKTRDHTVLFVISDDPKGIEEIFDAA